MIFSLVPTAFAAGAGSENRNSNVGPLGLTVNGEPQASLAPGASQNKDDGTTSAESGLTKYESSGRLPFSKTEAATHYEADELVTFIVVTEDEPLLANFSVADIAAKTVAVQNHEKLQTASLDKIKAGVLASFGNEKNFKLGYTYTIAMTGFSVKTAFGNKAALEKIPGVKSVYVAPVFSLPEDGLQGELRPMTSNATDMIGANVLNGSGYTGKGMRVAILDTGILVTHPNFQALPESALSNPLTKESINDIWNELNAGQMTSKLNQSYVSSKLPFVFNYDNFTFDVNNMYAGSDHGTHVAGIAAANKIEGSEVVGVAPDAQIVVMQVFSSDGGAPWDNIMAAMEDCVRLEVDSVNLSLGAAAGFTDPDDAMMAVMDLYMNSDIQLLIASGNDTHSAVGNNWGLDMPLLTDPDIGLTSTPASYSAALCVASIDNNGYRQLYITAGDREFGYQDTAVSSASNFLINFMGETLEYVVVPGVGAEADYEGLNVVGKVALVSRGTTSFPEKQETAQAHGAIACLVYNNALGIINMQINDGEGYIPCVSVSKAAGAYLIERAEAGNATFTVCNGDTKLFKLDTTVSSFSSWGVTPDLKLKPEISGVGGDIYSCVDPAISGSYYGSMSGTSMATPQITGAMAVLTQYLQTNYPNLKGTELRQAVANLLMSTAVPAMATPELEYSPRAQGAGLANLVNATTSPAYLSNPAASEGRPKAEIGDNDSGNGIYKFAFCINNLSDKELTYEIDSSILTETIYADYFIGCAPYGLEAKVEIAGGNTVTVPANGTATLIATLRLTENDMKYLSVFPNGIYVEGFLYANPVNADGVRLTMPIVGFYGDWSAADIFDTEDASMASLYPAVVYTYASQVGTNPYFRNGNSGSRYNAFSYNNPLAEIDVGMLRSAKHMNITVVNTETGEEYYKIEGDYLKKSYYNYYYGMVIPFYLQADYGEVWDGMDANGNKLPDGTTVTYTLEAWLDDGDDEVDDVWSFDISVDDTKPVLTNAKDLQSSLVFENGRTYLRLDIEENRYLAAVLFESPDGTIMGKFELDNQLGEPVSDLFDITGFGNEFTIIVADYACNETIVEAFLNLGEHGADNPEAVPLDPNRLYGSETYSGAAVEMGWFSADKNGLTDVRNETFNASRYYSAEYVNGYLFAQNANTGNLELVTPSGTYWRTQELVTQNGEVGDQGYWVLYDMAMDYSHTRNTLVDPYGNSSGQDVLFAVGWKYGGDQNNDGHDDGYNALFRIWMSRYSGDVYVEEVGPISGTIDGVEILTFGITTDGRMYGIDTEARLYSLELSTNEWGSIGGAACTYIGTTPFVNEPYFAGLHVIQSMGYDHNTGKMYWYAHSQAAVGYYYEHTNITYIVNLENADCTEVGTYGPGGQTCLFVPHNIKSDMFTMGADATGFQVNPYSVTMVEGQTKQFKINWTPWNAAAQKVTWSSSDEAIALVDENGFVTAVSSGDVVISATSLVWDQWYWDNETNSSSPRWVERTQTAQVKVVGSQDAVYSFIVEDWANMGNRFSWATYADRTPSQITLLDKPMVSYVDPMSGETVTTNALWQGGAYYNGYVYTEMVLPAIDEFGGSGNASALFRTKVTKGETPAETVFGEPEYIGCTVGIEVGNMGFDYNTGRMYAVDLTNGGLAIVDLDTGSVDSLGALKGVGTTPAMCVTADGTIVVSDMYSTLYTVDVDTLEATPIGSLGIDSWYYGAMAYDYNTGNIYWNPCMSQNQSSFYLVRLEPDRWEPTRTVANIMKLGDVSTKAGVEQTVMFTIPDQEPETKQIPVEGIEITNGEAVAGLQGGTIQLGTVTTPVRPTVQAKTWVSSDESVVKVDRFGKVSLVGVGKATVTVTIANKNPEDGGPFSDSIEITVLESGGRFTAFLNSDEGGTGYYDFWISMEDYDLRHASADTSMIAIYSLRSGIYYDGYYYGYDAKGQFLRINAENPSDYKVLGSCGLGESDQVTAMAVDYSTGTVYGLTLTRPYEQISGNLVTIDLNTGLVTPVAALDYTRPVFALACDKDGVLYAAGSVNGSTSITNVYTLNKETAEYTEFATVEGACSYTGTNYYGDRQYNPQLTYDFGTNRLYLNATSDSQGWSDASGMFLIQLGEETPSVVSLGGISLYTRAGSTMKYGDVYLGLIAFIPDADELPVSEVNGIILNKDAARVNVGGTAQVVGKVRPSNAANSTLVWASEDETIATVDQSGLVTGVSVGTTVVTATSRQTGITVKCVITVVNVTGPQTYAYTASAQKDALITFNPALPAQTAEIIDTLSGGARIKGMAYGDNCLYYAVENGSFYLYRYDFATKQTTSVGHLSGNWTGLSDIALDVENNILYACGGFYLFAYDLSRVVDGYIDYVSWAMDSDYCTLAGITVVDGAIYTIGTDFYTSAPKLMRYSDIYLSDRQLVSADFGITISKESSELAYDAAAKLFYLTDAGNNLYTMALDGTNATFVDILGNGIDLNGLAIDSTPSYVVIYTDGVDGEVLFADQRYVVPAGAATPAFRGTPTRPGYTFAGWMPVVSETAEESVTYVATWTVNDYTITLDALGGEVDPAFVTVTFGAQIPALPTPVRDGYLFLGWFNVDGEEVKAGELYTLPENSTLYAKWQCSHKYVSIVYEPTCSSDGFTMNTCSQCGDSFISNPVSATGHSFVTDEAVAPTCVSTGLTAGEHCALCGMVTVKQEVVPTVEHTWLDATYEAPKTCAVCGATVGEALKRPVEVDTGDVAITAPEGVDADKAQEIVDSLTEAAGAVQQPETGIDSNAAVIESAKENIKDENCEKIVGNSYETSLNITMGKVEIAAEGEDTVVVRIVYEVTPYLYALSEDGSVLGETKLNNFETEVTFRLPLDKNLNVETVKVLHEGELLGYYPVQTDENGNKFVEVKSKNFSEFTVEAHNHEYTAEVTAPTCTTAGFTTYTCACGDTYTADEVSALGHTEVVDAAVAATCTTAGKTEGKHCSVCGEVLAPQTEVPATGHSFGEWVVTKEATEQAEGEETRTCACGEKETRSIAKLEPAPTEPTEPKPTEPKPTEPQQPGEESGSNTVVIVIVVIVVLGVAAAAVVLFLNKKKRA